MENKDWVGIINIVLHLPIGNGNEPRKQMGKKYS